MIVELFLNYVVDRLFLYQLAATVVTYSALRIAIFYHVRKRRFELLSYYGIPGPKPRLLDGSLMLYKSTQMTVSVDAELQKKYGKIYGVYMGDEPMVTITDLEILRKIFFEKQSSFKERTHVFLEVSLTKGFIFAPHHKWKWLRKTFTPFFSAFTMRGHTSAYLIEDVVKLMIAYIESKLDDNRRNSDSAEPARITLDIHNLMKATALKLINGLAINLPDVDLVENGPYVDSLDESISILDSDAFIYAVRFPFIKRAFEFLDAYMNPGKTMSSIRRVLNKTIDDGLKNLARSKSSNGNQTRASSNQPQLIDTLIQLHYEGKLSREEVIGNCEIMLSAGYDTSSITLVYIFWVLGKYPEIQDKLREELMAHGTESKYLEQVINETMRLYPTVLNFTTRLATENVTIDDVAIPSGTQVVYHSWLMHRDPNLWPEPTKFDPERFRSGVHIHPCAFAPFGLGERKCIGYHLAQLEFKMVTCDIVCRYRIRTKAPDDMRLKTYANHLTRPTERVVIELERIFG